MILRISLRPLDKFFFGEENSFNEGEKKERADDRRSTYILHSRYFPQQTGALGLIRNQLLLQHGLLADNTERMSKESRKAARELIGSSNYRKGEQKAYGLIQRLSPVFLEAEDAQIIVPAPLDDCKVEQGDNEKEAMTFHLEEDLATLIKYREKAGLTNQFQHPALGNESQEKLFLKQKQVGITKAVKPWSDGVNTGDDESGYYYQEFLAFRQKKADFPISTEEVDQKQQKDTEPKFLIGGYTFYVELSDDQGLEDAIVEFGGERSTFEMKVEVLDEGLGWPDLPAVKYQHTQLSKTAKEAKIRRLVCLSPCWVEDISALKDHSFFRVTESLSFRFLKSRFEDEKNSSEGTTNFQQVYRGKKDKRKNGLYESKLFHFLDRGSVIYYKPDQEAALLALFDQKDLKTIGYNEIHIIK